jgi:NADH-quinone oxidoreductase subunit L
MTVESMSYLSNLAWMVPFFPFFAFILISVLTMHNRHLSAMISIFSIVISAILAGAILHMRLLLPGAPPFLIELPWITIGNIELPIGILINNLSSTMLFVVSFIASLIQIYSVGYMDHEEEASFSRYFAFMSLFAASMLGLVISPNFFQIYIFWELVGLCSYLLIGFWYKKKSASDAAKKAFIVTRFGDLGFLIGIICLYLLTRSFSFTAIPELLQGILKHPDILNRSFPGLYLSPEFIVNSVMFLIFCGAIGKSAMFPLHVWLPDAMEGPTPVSALIHAATMVAAGVFMVAQTFEIFRIASHTMLIIAYIGGFTAFIAATMGLVQNDIKRVLAYSTISQLGYMMMGLGVGGFVGSTFHLVTHAFFKALLFLCAGYVIHALHTNNIWEMGNLSRAMRVTWVTFLIGALSLAGIPPLSGFVSKDEILSSLALNPQPVLYFFGYSVVFLTALYMSRVYFVAFKSQARYSHEPEESSLFMTAPLVILAAFSAVLGILGPPFSTMFGQFASAGRDIDLHHAFDAGPMLISFVIALFGIATGFAFYGKNAEERESMLKEKYKALYSMLINKYWMDDIWEFVVRRIVFAAGRFAAFIDVHIIDRMVNLLAQAADESGKLLRHEETGMAQHYALIMILSFVIILVGLSFLDGTMNSSIFSLLLFFSK